MQHLNFGGCRSSCSRLKLLLKIVAFSAMALFGHFNSSFARVFNYNDVWVTAYISGSGGLSNLQSDAFEDSSGDVTYFANKEAVNYNFTGEFGFAFIIGKNAELQLGVMGFKSKTSNANGLDTSGGSLLTVESVVSSFVPVARLSTNILNNGVSRVYMFGGIGYATTKVSNDYAVSGLGVAEYGGGAAYSEKWEAISTMYEVGGGLETFVFDNVTLGLFAGWRVFDVPKFKYGSDVAAIRGGGTSNLTGGSTVNDNSNKKIGLDLGGAFVGLAIRFYIPPLN